METMGSLVAKAIEKGENVDPNELKKVMRNQLKEWGENPAILGEVSVNGIKADDENGDV